MPSRCSRDPTVGYPITLADSATQNTLASCSLIRSSRALPLFLLTMAIRAYRPGQDDPAHFRLPYETQAVYPRCLAHL